jgi:hypothetical protein
VRLRPLSSRSRNDRPTPMASPTRRKVAVAMKRIDAAWMEATWHCLAARRPAIRKGTPRRRRRRGRIASPDWTVGSGTPMRGRRRSALSRGTAFV